MSKFIFRCTLSLFKLNMDENIFKYGSYDVDKGTLLKSLLYENNIRSFSRHKRYTPEQESEFRDIVYYLQNGIKNNTISGTGLGKFTDVSETPMEYSEIYGDALNYVHQIANKIGDSASKKKKSNTDKSVVFDAGKHGFHNYFLNTLDRFGTTSDYTQLIKDYTNSFEGDLSRTIADFNLRITNYQKANNNFTGMDISAYGYTTPEEYNADLDKLKVQLSDGSVGPQDRILANSLGIGSVLNAVFGKAGSQSFLNPLTSNAFNPQKHGFRSYFAKSIASPFSSGNTYNTDLTDYINKFAGNKQKLGDDIIAKIYDYQKANNDFTEYDFSSYGLKPEEYNKTLEELKAALIDSDFSSSDYYLAKKVGMHEVLSEIFGNPTGGLNQATVSNPETPQMLERKWGDDTAVSEYIQQISNSPWLSGMKESDKMRLGALAADVFSLIWEGPGLAATAGYFSDTLSLIADNKDGINDSYWDDALNYTFSTLGAIPLVGNVFLGWKGFKNLQKVSKLLIPLVTGMGAAGAVANSSEIIESIENIGNGKFDVNDLRNLYTVLTLATGFGNFMRSRAGYKTAKEAMNSAEDALQVSVKRNGKTEDILISDQKGIDDLTKLKDKPDEFKQYLKDNYEGFDDFELKGVIKLKVKVEDPDATGWFKGLKRKTVETESVSTVTGKGTPDLKTNLWTNRARHYLDDVVIGNKTKRKTNSPVDDNLPKNTGNDVEGGGNNPKQENEIPSQAEIVLGNKPVDTEVPKTTETPKESQTLEGSTPASNIEPNVLSEVSRENIKKYKGKINTLNQVSNALKLTTSNEEYKVASLLLDRLKKSRNFRASNKVGKDGKGGSLDFQSFVNYIMRLKGCGLEEAVAFAKKFGFHKQGGILKAEGGIKVNVNLLNDDTYFGWDNFFKYDANTGTLSLLPNYDKEKFNTWLTTNNLLFNAPTKNYGNNYTIPKGDYITVYDPNAMSIGLKGANSSLRSTNLIPSAANPDSEINLNLHLKPMYDGEHKKNRVNDILNFYNNSGLEAKNIDLFLNNYNKKIDQMYAYKRSTEGTTYDKNGNDLTRSFNQDHNSIYKSHNDRYGYDIDTEHINGSATMARGIDITDGDIELDMSSDANFSKMLGNKKLYKAANGRLYYIDPATATLSTLDAKDPDKPGVTHDMGGGGNNDKISDPLPTKKDYVDYQVPISAAQLLSALYANKKMYEINNLVEPLLYSPKEDYRWTYGNLRAMVAGRKQAADLARQVARPLTSDGSLQTAAAFEAFDQGQKYIQEGERIDDETLTENMEKAWLQNLENHENRYNIAMKNRENMHQVDREKLLAKANWFRANYESIDNFTNAMKTLIVTDLRKKESMLDMYHQLGLRQWSERNPNLIVDNWGKYEQSLWEKGTSGLEMTPEEQTNYNKLRKLVNMGYYRMLAADSNVYLTKPNAKSIEYPFDITVVPQNRQGGKITTEMSKTIISFLKEKNKNYNKAIDRSIRGLYNHIKLQRK